MLAGSAVEVVSLTSHMGLDNRRWVYDNNRITSEETGASLVRMTL